MNCPIRYESYDLQRHRPKRLSCGCTVCLSCLEILGATGQVTCPNRHGSQSYNDAQSFPDNKELLQRISQNSLKCSKHREEEATKFCKTHLLAVCCECERKHGFCETNEYRCFSSSVRSFLKSGTIVMSRELNELGKTLVPPYREVIENLEDSSQEQEVELELLLKTHAEVYELFQKSWCSCGRKGIAYVDATTMKSLCDACYGKYPQAYSAYMEITANEPILRSRILETVRARMQSTHFLSLSFEQCQWLKSPPAGQNFIRFLHTARLIVIAASCPPEQVPSPAYCPFGHYLNEDTLLKLPCPNVMHAVCESCVQGLISVRCPLDWREYSTDAMLLERVELQQIVDPNYRSRVGANLPLAQRGRVIPCFVPTRRSRTDLPIASLRAVDRFISVLPDEGPQDETDSDSLFLKPWIINKRPNQVEALTFRSQRAIRLWGVGLGKPVGNLCIKLLSVELYQGSRASGAPRFTAQIQVSELAYMPGTVLEDIYFVGPVPVEANALMTLKVKMKPRQGTEMPLEVYHGNHIGRYSEHIGGDGTKFDFVKTESVDPSEWLGRQQEIIGPILRLIYEPA